MGMFMNYMIMLLKKFGFYERLFRNTEPDAVKEGRKNWNGMGRLSVFIVYFVSRE
jgi:hypothetical protein